MQPLPLWQRAASYAAFKHRHQTRKDGRTPYIAHPFRVAMTVRDVFDCADPQALAAALLHDVIEDTTTDYDDIADLFGEGVAEIVSAVTKAMHLPERAREAEYDARLARAPWQARLIKLADAYDNLSDAHTSPPGTLSADHMGRTIERAERAIAIAAAAEHPALARAVRAVQELVASLSGR
ncbi:MAG: bifunctional (p)ppGpp synthetase/guanosine-3',5'-bis(diphosphate) 3'-pyrophosphohydrolase [Phycisphaerales bacterium]|nr:bifunctional (p)ppGpp synthetase/guanosine-3',5'-bis(diphosphate) 3'-pyrophosphohydrolase [Phycisphaerales bacterium]